jgi:heptosyltransferase-2
MNQIRILIRTPNWIGDQILSYPFFYYLRKAYPDAFIAAVCVPWVSELQYLGLIDEVIEVSQPPAGSGGLSKIRHAESVAKKIRAKGPWNIGISLPNSFTSAWILYRSKVQLRRGFNTEGRGFLLNQSLDWDLSKNLHRADAFVRLLPDFAQPKESVRNFWGIPPMNDLDPGVPGTLSKFESAAEWKKQSPLQPPDFRYWVLAPGAMAESRRWDLERYLALARRVYIDTKLPCLIVGGPKEAPLAERLKESHDVKFLDWTAKGPPSGLCEVFSKAEFTISNDSGLAHIASLCGSRVFIMWGAGNPKITEPLGPGKVKTFFNPVNCWPCEKNICDLPDQKLACLKGIEPDTVWEEIRSDVPR